MLLGAQYLPVSVTNKHGYPLQTKHARLKRSLLTGKYLLFGAAKESDTLIESDFPYEDNVDIHSVGIMTVDEQIEFCNQEMQDQCFLSTLDGSIVDIDDDTDAEEDVIDVGDDEDVDDETTKSE